MGVELQPNESDVHRSLALALAGDGAEIPAEAVNHLAQAIDLAPNRPSNVAVLPKMAQWYESFGEVEGAIEMFQLLLALRPQEGSGYNDFAAFRIRMGQRKEAQPLLEQALQLLTAPFAKAAAHANLGMLQSDLGMLDGAMKHLRAAVNLEPLRMVSLNAKLGEVQWRLGQPREGAHTCSEAIKIMKRAGGEQGRRGALYRCVGDAEMEMGHTAAAIKALKMAVKLGDDASGYNNLGAALRVGGELEEAIAAFKKATELEPTKASSYYKLGVTLRERDPSPEVFAEALTLIDKAAAVEPGYHAAVVDQWYFRQLVASWRGRKQYERAARGDGGGSMKAFYSLFLSERVRDPKFIVEMTRARVHDAVSQPNARCKHRKSSLLENGGNVGRLGYISSDLVTKHVVGHLVKGIFSSHDRSRFEVLVYSTSTAPAQKRLSDIPNHPQIHRYYDIDELEKQEATEEQNGAVEAMCGSEGSWLVDLNGHTDGVRFDLLSLRSHPIQVFYLGTPFTTGAGFIHYFMTDLRATPPASSRDALTESLVFLPHTFQVNSYMMDAAFRVLPPVDESEAFVRKMRLESEVPSKAVVLCSMAGIASKLSPEVLTVWLQSLHRGGEESHLWFSGIGKGPLQSNLLSEALARGITLRSLLFSEKAEVEEYIKRSRLADIFIDTPIANSIASGSDHIWAGVPLMTMTGHRMVSRGASSVVSAAGLGDSSGLIVDTFKAYEDGIFALAIADSAYRY